MIRYFADNDTEKIYRGIQSPKFPPSIQNTARRKLRMIAAAAGIDDLRIPPGNLAGYYSIRINDQWRVVFKYTEGGAEEVGIKDYH
jgi:proteic killer suppression protein